eukprot:TRINITY_DN67072_c0_g1_i1.p3 TRINITY_DN67072_c0_g1~~TRINITY_DN67072_c0_g1_i1.p3  ORF type:complete len:202 (-),score=36.56 TRINITY_DN67072_c0_g1_i1:1287-1892(-)
MLSVSLWVFFFFSSRRRHTRCREVSWARRCVQETGICLGKHRRLLQIFCFRAGPEPCLDFCKGLVLIDGHFVHDLICTLVRRQCKHGFAEFAENQILSLFTLHLTSARRAGHRNKNLLCFAHSAFTSLAGFCRSTTLPARSFPAKNPAMIRKKKIGFTITPRMLPRRPNVKASPITAMYALELRVGDDVVQTAPDDPSMTA